MAVPKVQYTPIKAPRGRLVHAVALTDQRTPCGKLWRVGGWRIALERLTCPDCKLAIGPRELARIDKDRR